MNEKIVTYTFSRYITENNDAKAWICGECEENEKGKEVLTTPKLFFALLSIHAQSHDASSFTLDEKSRLWYPVYKRVTMTRDEFGLHAFECSWCRAVVNQNDFSHSSMVHESTEHLVDWTLAEDAFDSRMSPARVIPLISWPDQEEQANGVALLYSDGKIIFMLDKAPEWAGTASAAGMSSWAVFSEIKRSRTLEDYEEDPVRAEPFEPGLIRKRIPDELILPEPFKPNPLRKRIHGNPVTPEPKIKLDPDHISQLEARLVNPKDPAIYPAEVTRMVPEGILCIPYSIPVPGGVKYRILGPDDSPVAFKNGEFELFVPNGD